MAVFVLDKRKRPLMPYSERRARLLLERGRARTHRMVLFTIRLVDRRVEDLVVPPVRLKWDPGSKTTGLALVRETTLTWVQRLRRWVPVTALSQELVRFDTQALQNPEISGAEYQQGTLFGYEVREYLLEKWGRKCAYCGAEHAPLPIDQIHPKSRGGSDRVSNLTLACLPCNQRKNARDVAVFLAHDPERLEHIERQRHAPLADAAAVNSTRWALWGRLRTTGLDGEVGTGGRAKWNRSRLGVPKGHGPDAARVGHVDAVNRWRHQPVLAIRATGRGAYRRTRLTRHGFPRGYLTRRKSAFGFQTGDMVRAVVTTGRKVGTDLGRVAIRASGSFNIQTGNGLIQGIHHRFCALIQRTDGYGYSWTPRASTQRDAGMGVAYAAALSRPGMDPGVSRANG